MFRTIATLLGTMREALVPTLSIEPERLGVRPATHQDLDAIVGLNSMLGQEQADRFGATPGSLLRPRNVFKQAIGDRRSLLLVATVDGAVAGYALAYPAPRGDRRATWLEAIFVARKFRNSSLPDWLATEVVKRLRESGATEIMTQVSQADSATSEVLSRAGLKDLYAVMRRPKAEAPSAANGWSFRNARRA